MILTIEFQILINIARINSIAYIIYIFSPPLYVWVYSQAVF